MPEFVGNIQEWMSAHLQYPPTARSHNEEGRVGVQFVVSETGKITDVVVARSSKHPSLDAEAVRVISAMPNWKPGMLDGTAVPVLFTMPVSFRLE